MRVIVQGDEIVESTPRERERGMLLRLGDFYWQEPGAKRPARNIATSRVELVGNRIEISEIRRRNCRTGAILQRPLIRSGAQNARKTRAHLGLGLG